MAIDDRKQRVLRAIVSLYGTEGEPVGSGVLAQYFDMAVSSATLRNEMAALTRLGLLEQPHTSAGRVPSAKGYRYYIDNLLESGTVLGKAQQREIDDIFRELDYDPARLAEGAAKALAQRTGLSVVATTPRSEDATVAHYELIQVGRSNVAVLAVTNAGSVRTRVARLDAAANPAQLAAVSKAVNALLTFRAAADITLPQVQAIATASGQNGEAMLPVVKAAYQLLAEAGTASVFLEGQQNLLHYRELYDSLQTLMDLFSNEDAVQAYVSPRSERVTVLLGDDMPRYNMPGLCIISKQYVAGGGRRGALAVAGPTRVPYMEVIPQLEYFALLLGQAMTGLTE